MATALPNQLLLRVASVLAGVLTACAADSDGSPADTSTSAATGSESSTDTLTTASATGSQTASSDEGTETTAADSDDDADSSSSETTGTPPSSGEPLFDGVLTYSGELPVLGDPTDIYWPDGDGAFPVALMLQGAEVDKQYYSEFASMVARYGFVVVVPNHESSGVAGTGLYMEQSVIVDALAGIDALGDDAETPLLGHVDASAAGLVGHSYGGVVGVYALTGQCMFPFCTAPFELPAAVRAGAFYGTNMRSPFGGPIAPLANDGLGVALIQGTLDTKATPADGIATYGALQTPPGAYVTLIGANHYGNTDVDNPPGAGADASAPTLDQAVGVETVGRFSGNFLRAWVLDDADAQAYVSGPTGDPNVLVMLLE
ncbi:MAG: hypothetical protein IAG13_05645 [Deltaproteobacteria bacterium]|nr:hypothetical protein [Nannocystaceae bacterium]